ncbi:MAG: tagaturonate reductase [Acutalibacteraceae bacterium]|nr:tagaturonate reductase [Acutalibacteraceae bacterium]
MEFTKVNRTEKVIQFGEGGFLRGFVDWILQILNEETEFEGSAVVVQPIAQGMCDALEKQNCIYTHVMRGLKDGELCVDKKLIDVISRTVKPYDDYDAYLKLAENPDFRFIVSNTTESGIVYTDEDNFADAPHKTFPAKLTALLWKRFKLALNGFIFLPCELIDKNGENLKKCILKYADKWELGADFKAWIENENIFCNTLVDRIVTGYPRDEKIDLGYEDNMVNTSELFHLWVIEGPKSILEEIPFDKTNLNIIVTDNLEMYRTRKVRILNGAHTSMIPYAMLEGIETVKDCMENEKMSAFVNKCVFDEIIPTLDLPKDELIDYANNVFERFNNPFIKHLCASISLNSVSKFKVRVLPSLLEYIKRTGEKPQNLIFSLAQLIEFYKNGTPTDDEEIIDFIKNSSLEKILKNKSFWDTDLSFLLDEVQKYVN